MTSRTLLTFTASALITGVATAQHTTSTARTDWTALNPVTPFSAATFAHPSQNDRPWVRLNTPDSLSSDELKAEIAEMKQHGIGGLEIGQGAFPATPQLIAILQAANQQGLKVSLSHGSTTAPAGYTLNEENGRTTLVYTAATVSAGQTAEITLKAPPPPVPRGFGGGGGRTAPAPRRSTLVAVHAYRCTATCHGDGPATLDPASVLELTATVTGTDHAGAHGGSTSGKIVWTAPASGEWRIVTLWAQGAYAQPDLFSKEGTDELIRGMEADWTPEVKALLKRNGGDIFYDSHSSDRGSPTELWTNNMEAEFKVRRGYSILANAPALFPESFTFSDGTASRVRNDLNAVRGDLWIEKHLKPLETWAHSYRLRLRLQPYGEMGLTPDEIQAASILDRPETESLFFGDEIDSFLPIASANHMTGNTWYSTECCAALSRAYAQTFQDAVIRMHREFAAGVTKLVYHVYPYRDAANAKWPGYHSFGSAGFSNAWGPRNPFWVDANAYNDYFARTQQVLTQGTAKVDVAVYMLSYTFPQPMQIKGGFHIWPDTHLQEAGYTRDYLDPALLAMPDATVTNGTLAAGKAAYKVLIFDREQQPAADPEKSSIPLPTARKMLSLAKAGLPIVIVGSTPDQVPGRALADDAAVKSTMAELRKLKTVHTVAHEAEVPAMLLSIGIHPAMEPAKPSPLRSLHRVDTAKGFEYYFLYNEGSVSPAAEPSNLFEPLGSKSFDGPITLHGRGKPYLLDAWSGAIEPIRNYEQVDGGVRVNIHMAQDDAAILVVSTTPLTSAVEGTALLSRQASTGSVMDLTARPWHLSVEEWKPKIRYGATGAAATQTQKTQVDIDLDKLEAWTKIPSLQHASGIGTYSLTWDMPADWKAGATSILRLGEVMDSFQVTINGKDVPVNQISAMADVSRYLKTGTNTISVRVATTLNNQLEDLDADVKKRNLTQEYGLIGPVALEVYRQ